MTVKILTGDALEQLRLLESGSVQCCVTSPPYYGLRDYGTGGQIGLEEKPDDYVAKLVDVFREVRRVMRDDGTLWLNIGDSYCSTDKWGGGRSGNRGKHTLTHDGDVASWAKRQKKPKIDGVKPKDLIGIPWMLAFALRADGWYLRDEIVWRKPNPMPSSVTDRCTPSHEKVFLLAKSKRYFFDAEAIAEEATGRSSGNGFDRPERISIGGRGREEQWEGSEKRNCRNVWSIATQPFPGAHYAVMPPALAERCILAGTSEKGCCSECGAPLERVMGKTGRVIQQQNGPGTNKKHIEGSGQHGATSSITTGISPEKATVGWKPSCDCEAGISPCVVLDPFGGAGTTGMVADRLQRDAILIELNPVNVEMARERIYGDAPLLAEVG